MSLIKVEDIAFVSFTAPDLGKMKAFLEDFGLELVGQADESVLRMRGTGPAPFLHETRLGDAGFAGLGLRASTVEDLEILARAEGAEVKPFSGPGGGMCVSLVDPEGLCITVVAGQSAAAERDGSARTSWNSADQKNRERQTRNPSSGRATVVRLGHAVFATSNIERSVRWWKDRFGFITSDEVREGGVQVAAFMRCDRGDALTDHHTITFSQLGGNASGFHHAAFEVRDFDDLMTGHEYLAQRNFTPIWGIGRHVVGSQIFDYWLDPFGNRVEHWTDGDVFVAADGSNVVGLDVMLSNHWGPGPSPLFMGAADEGAAS